MVDFVLILLLSLVVPVLIVTSCMIYCLLKRQIKAASDNLYSTTPTTISTVESATVKSVPNALHRDAQASVIIEQENAVNTDDIPLPAVLTFSRTPFGTRTMTAFDLGASLHASWTAAGQTQGPESLAAALEGVLTLHRHLEELRGRRQQHEKEHASVESQINEIC